MKTLVVIDEYRSAFEFFAHGWKKDHVAQCEATRGEAVRRQRDE